MGLKIKRVLFVILLINVFLINIIFVSAHVCSDVLPGGSQYQPGCEPVVITVPSANQNGNTVSLTINVANRRTPYPPATSCGNPYSGSLTNVRISSIEPIPDCSGCFSMNNPGSYTIASNTNRNYNVVVTIDSGATAGTYNLRFIVSLNEGVDRYIDVEDIVVEGSSCSDECSPSGSKQCSGNSYQSCSDSDSDGCLEWGSLIACSSPTPYCSSGNCVQCTAVSQCSDTICREPTCSGGSCGSTLVASGVTDEACTGSTGCSGGSCKCNGAGSCTSQPSCTSVCTNGARQCSGNSYQICSDTNSDGCYEWGSLVACSGGTPYCSAGYCVQCTSASQCTDNVCKTPTCSGNSCGETNVASGLTDTGCSGSTGCSGGSCKCDGAGSCTSQPSCTNDCSPSGSRQCSGNSYQTCGEYDADGCLEWSSLTACSGGTPYCSSGSCVQCTAVSQCSDTICREPTCSGGSCGSTLVASGVTDEACTGSTGCSGGSCKCNGAGSCTSQPSCTSVCSPLGSRQCSGTSNQTCYDTNSDGCLEWGSLVACPDTVCSVPTCSGGNCGSSFVSSGLTDTGCSGSTGCSGGSCKCNGAGSCTSQPSCTSVCTNGARQCSGNSYQICSDTNSDGCYEWGSLVACSGGTPYCSAGYCTQCTSASQCGDSNSCTTDACNSGVCTHTTMTDGSVCGTGRCCSGTCDTTLGNSGFDDTCRSGPSCVGTSWEYSYTNNGNLCGGYACRECSNGLCVFDDNSRCNSGEVCSSGTCSSTGCTSNSDCSSPTPFCNTTSRQCVQCLASSACDDNNPCTIDICGSTNMCNHTSVTNGQTCVGCTGDTCQCSSGTCSCVPNCTGKSCGDNGCGGTCGTCNSYINGTRCYDSPLCTSGSCGFSLNTLTTSSNCCDHKFTLSNSNCIEENVPNSTKCTGDTYCSSLCTCIPNPCYEYDSASECTAQSSCEWCPLSLECHTSEEVECTSNSVCSTNGEYCSNSCKLSNCLGTDSSCGCSSGSCTVCASGQNCDNNACVQSLIFGCTPSWTCSSWTPCNVQGKRIRTCDDSNRCNTTVSRPALSEACTYGSDSADTSALGSSSDAQKNLSASNNSNKETTEKADWKSKGAVVWIIIGVILLVVLGGLYYFFKGSSGGGAGTNISGKQNSNMQSTNSSSKDSLSNPEAKPAIGVSPEVKLDRYVKFYLDKNIAPEYISQYLVGKGWSKEAISNSLKKFPSAGGSNASVSVVANNSANSANVSQAASPNNVNPAVGLGQDVKLDRYVKFYLDKNIAPEYISQYLVGKGWSQEAVKISLKKFGK